MLQFFRQLVKWVITVEYFTVSLCKKFWSGNASVPFIPKPVELEKDVISALFCLTGKPAIVQHKYSGPAALNSSFRYSVTIMTRLKYDKIHWHVGRAAIITVWLHWTKRRTRSVWCSTRTNKQTNKQTNKKQRQGIVLVPRSFVYFLSIILFPWLRITCTRSMPSSSSIFCSILFTHISRMSSRLV